MRWLPVVLLLLAGVLAVVFARNLPSGDGGTAKPAATSPVDDAARAATERR